MIIELKKFGQFLTSRPAGREAFLAAKAYSLPKGRDEKIIIDFAGVLVLSPSWADEFITKIKEKYKNLEFRNTENSSVQITLKLLKLI